MQLTKCRDIKMNLIDLLDGSIVGDRRKELELHLDSCPNCRALLAEYQPLFENHGIELPAELSDDLWRGIQRRTNRLDDNRLSRLPLLSRWRPVISFSIRSFGLIAAVAAGIFLGNLPAATERADETEIVDYYAAGFASSSAGSVSDALYEVTSSEGEGK